MSGVKVKDSMVHIFVGVCLLVMLSACQTTKQTEVMGTESLHGEAQMSEPEEAVQPMDDALMMSEMEKVSEEEIGSMMKDSDLDGVMPSDLVEDRDYAAVTDPDPRAMMDEMEQDAMGVELSHVFFDYDRYAIRDDAVGVLQKNAGMLRNKYRDAGVLIEGHCDERGTVDYNLELGKRRAQAVKDYLVDLGVPEVRISIVSYGKEKPFCMASEPSCWAENRRAHFQLQN